MWPMPPYSNSFVTISFYPNHLGCYWFEQNRNQKKLHLKAYQTIELDNLELEHLVIFNPSYINRFIQEFLKKNHLINSFALFCLNGPCISEQFITVKDASPEPDQLTVPGYQKLIWDYVYLYPTQEGQFTFYVAGIRRELLFQYQLLALRNQLNLIAITPATMALIGLYKYHKGPQFRHSQLGVELEQHNHKAEHLFDESFINSLLSINPALSITITDEIPLLLPALGLFTMRNISNAYY